MCALQWSMSYQGPSHLSPALKLKDNLFTCPTWTPYTVNASGRRNIKQNNVMATVGDGWRPTVVVRNCWWSVTSMATTALYVSLHEHQPPASSPVGPLAYDICCFCVDKLLLVWFVKWDNILLCYRPVVPKLCWTCGTWAFSDSTQDYLQLLTLF